MLPKDATLRSIRSLLAEDDAFVSKAYGVLRRYQRDRSGDPLVLRIGITGTGQYPNYRIDDAAVDRPIVAIDGGSHGPWASGEGLDASVNWSDAAMTLDEVEDLLGEIRNYARPKR